jgi:transcriptional regulator with XRE-family HTH domain
MSFQGFDSTVLFLPAKRAAFLRTEPEVNASGPQKGKNMYFNQVEFGKRIKEERNRLQMTQEDLAQELNIGYVHMNGIENGRKGCSIDLLLEIAEVLDVSTDYLLTGRLSGETNTAKKKLKEIAARLNEIVGQLDA